MTWTIFGFLAQTQKHAVSLAACFLFVVAAQAEDVTLRDASHGVQLTGRFLGYDGEFATVLTPAGPVTLRGDGLTCEGRDCPDFENYFPHIRFVGADRVGAILLPALIEVYARDRSFNLQGDIERFTLASPDMGGVLDISIDLAGPNESFAAFIGHDADILMSVRELNATERDLARDAGLGRLNLARQGRILALDALVPVTSPSSGKVSISIVDLTRALAGQFEDQFTLHMFAGGTDQLKGFEDRFMRPSGYQITANAMFHDTEEDLLAAIEEDKAGLALLPYGATRNTQPLGLRGPCGLQSDARFLTLKTEDYPLTFPVYLYQSNRRQHPHVTDFLDWLRSPSAQLVIRRAGFVDLAAVPIPLSQQGGRLANAIRNAGEEISLEELQRMISVLSPSVRMSSTFRFEQGSTRLDGQSRSNIMQLAQAVRDGQFGGRELMLVGFSDGRGPAAANRELSAARAVSVRQALVSALGGNVPNNVTIQTEAFGEALPMACDDSIWGQQTNRRVELWVRDLP